MTVADLPTPFCAGPSVQEDEGLIRVAVLHHGFPYAAVRHQSEEVAVRRAETIALALNYMASMSEVRT